MTATLMTHCGAVQVQRDELDLIDAPPPTDTWFPVRHSDVINGVTKTLTAAGFQIAKQSFALSHGNHRMFSTMDLTVPLHTGVSLAIGIRNSTDKTFPLGFCAGNRVFVCDNLAFSAELLVKRKHTRFGQERFREAIVEAVTNLDQFRKAEANRINFMEHQEINDTAAESIILRSFERGLVPHTALHGVLNEWRQPSYDFGDLSTLWRLYNAFTTILADRAQRNPQRHAALTIDLKDLIESHFPKMKALELKAPEVNHAIAA